MIMSWGFPTTVLTLPIDRLIGLRGGEHTGGDHQDGAN
jgi:hypothetical protein